MGERALTGPVKELYLLAYDIVVYVIGWWTIGSGHIHELKLILSAILVILSCVLTRPTRLFSGTDVKYRIYSRYKKVVNLKQATLPIVGRLGVFFTTFITNIYLVIFVLILILIYNNWEDKVLEGEIGSQILIIIIFLSTILVLIVYINF